ncbi:GNAT family N-acetyltransferase [Candidatus Micrarchaeota archaeon]|nr:GNAT family N-acetyltransferase [Candidatus Micrarchaeota archaeon]
MIRPVSLRFEYASPEKMDVDTKTFILSSISGMSAASEFGQKNKDLSGKTAEQQIETLKRRGYGALVAYEKNNPVGLITFQDHLDGSRHAFLIHTVPSHRNRGIALECLREFVERGFKEGINQLRLSQGASGRKTPKEIISLLTRFNKMHAQQVGASFEESTGFIQRGQR